MVHVVSSTFWLMDGFLKGSCDIGCFSPNSVSTLWGSYGKGKEWCPWRCPSATAAFDCAGSHRVPFASTVCGRSSVAGFWVVLPGVRALFGAKRGFT